MKMIKIEIPTLGEFEDPRPHIQGDLENFSQARVNSTYVQCAKQFVELSVWCLVNRDLVTWEPAAIWGLWSIMEMLIDIGVDKNVRDQVTGLLPAMCVLPEPFEIEIGFATDIPRDGDE